MTEQKESQRIDKWLWHGRFTKTRSLAQKLVKNGKVRIDREKITNTSQAVKPGNVLTISISDKIRIIQITGIGTRRGPYNEAKELYEDITPISETRSKPAMAKVNVDSISPGGRPDKHQRRKLIELKHNSGG